MGIPKEGADKGKYLQVRSFCCLVLPSPSDLLCVCWSLDIAPRRGATQYNIKDTLLASTGALTSGQGNRGGWHATSGYQLARVQRQSHVFFFKIFLAVLPYVHARAPLFLTRPPYPQTGVLDSGKHSGDSFSHLYCTYRASKSSATPGRVQSSRVFRCRVLLYGIVICCGKDLSIVKSPKEPSF